MPLEDVEGFVVDVGAALTLDGVFASLQRQMDRLGFEKFSYELIWPPEGPRYPCYLSSFSLEWTARYLKQKYISDDIVGLRSINFIEPFLWDKAEDPRHLTPTQRLIFNEAAEFGLKTGGAAPIHGPGAAKALLSVASNQKNQEFQKLFSANRHELHLIATYAHKKILSLNSNKTQPIAKLTPRQIEVLTWTARGKTSSEIAEILRMEYGTVESHLKKCSITLNTMNKTHAVAVALANGLIIP